MKPFRVALISLLFDVIYITHQLRYHQLTTWQRALLVMFTALGRCVCDIRAGEYKDQQFDCFLSFPFLSRVIK